MCILELVNGYLVVLYLVHSSLQYLFDWFSNLCYLVLLYYGIVTFIYKIVWYSYLIWQRQNFFRLYCISYGKFD